MLRERLAPEPLPGLDLHPLELPAIHLAARPAMEFRHSGPNRFHVHALPVAPDHGQDPKEHLNRQNAKTLTEAGILSFIRG